MPSKLGHESDGISTNWVLFAAIGIAILVPLIMLGVWFDYRALAGKRYAGVAHPTVVNSQSQPVASFPEPRLIKTPGAQLAEVRSNQESKLESYGWVNQSNGVVRLPIERAMDLLAARGLPVRGSNGDSIGPSEYDLTTRRRLDSNAAPIKEIK